MRARPSPLVASGELSGGRARIGPGVRLERTGDEAGVSAKLGGAVPLGGPLSLRASAGRTYRVPSFSELYLEQGVVAPNPALRPEVGIGGDAALVAEGTLGTASLGAFSTLYRDLVVYQSVSFRRLVPLNTDRSLVRGARGGGRDRAAAAGGGARGPRRVHVHRARRCCAVARTRASWCSASTCRASRATGSTRESGSADRPPTPTPRPQWISRQWLGFGHVAPDRARRSPSAPARRCASGAPPASGCTSRSATSSTSGPSTTASATPSPGGRSS